MGSLLLALLQIADILVQLVIFVIIASVILSWLFAFGVVNPYNPTVRQIQMVISGITDPVLRPARRFIPTLGGLDLSALVTLLVLQILVREWLFHQVLAPAFARL